jgi:predicted molibdopterin-dependent oxidoreductase YjgC
MDNIITINGTNYNFETGETILDVARKNDIYIPTICHLKGATPTGACRICIVEVKGAPGPIAACSTPAVDKMEILTDTPRIIESRKMIVELLLLSGNHNCSVKGEFPKDWTDFQEEVNEYDKANDICVAYGKCELQALAYKYLAFERRMDRIPCKYPLEYDDPLIGRDFSRCILCGRCVQACNQVQVNSAVSHGYRGNLAKIVVKGDKTIATSDCVYCGECIQVCPVGALFEKRNRFDSRMWNEEHVHTTCHYCGVGCQLDLLVKDGKIIKVNGLEDAEPNHGRLCFKGRFGFDFIHSEKRLKKPMIKKKNKLTEVSWDEALDFIISNLEKIKKENGPDSIGLLASTKHTNEDLFAAKKFFKSIIGVKDNHITHFEPPAGIDIPYEEIKKASTIVIVGSDITRDNPVAASYVKQAVLNEVKLVVVDKRDTEISKYAKVHLRKLPGVEKEINSNTIIIYEPGYDISSIKNIDSAKCFSLAKENNTFGAYFMGITPQKDFDLKSFKFLYSMGQYIPKKGTIDFLVVQDIFQGDSIKNADVVLPAAIWVEYNGTYISSDYRISQVKKAIEPQVEAKPTWMIFKELAKKMGNNWDSTNSKEIWEKEIIPDSKVLKDFTYSKIENEGAKISETDNFSQHSSTPIPKDISKINDHKMYCEHCCDLQDIAHKLLKEVD